MTPEVFSNVRFANIQILLDIVLASQESGLAHVERVYSDKAEGYAETLACTVRLGLIKQRDEALGLSVDWVSDDEVQRRSVVLRHLFGARNRYRSEIQRYFEKFQVIDGEILYFPSTQHQSNESTVRNFLIETGVVEHVSGTQSYMITPEYLELYIDARGVANQTTPSMLTRRLIEKNDIGLAAELKILSYERERVGLLFANKVEHVSQRNVAAGYDIRSITRKSTDIVLPRLIEVKAVPNPSYQFYWSQNEIGVARKMSDWYHLYLLPFDRHGRFDLDGLKIVADPYSELMADSTDWVCEADTMVCYLRSTG